MSNHPTLDAATATVPATSQNRDFPKLFTIGILHMGQYFPAAFIGSALPFMFRKEGLPLEMFWLLALPLIPNWFKWLIALVVDNHGFKRIGHRKSWIIPCTLIGASCYGVLSLFPPSVELVYVIVGILLFKTLIMAAQDIAVDAYAAEAMLPHERPVGTSIINFLGAVAGVFGLGAVVLVESYGWPVATVLASCLLVFAALPAIVRPEPPPPELSRLRQERGEAPSLLAALKRRDSWFILPFLSVFGFGGAFFTAMLGPFFADKGMSLTDYGVLFLICSLTGQGLSAVAVPWLVDRIGLRNAGRIGVIALPLQGLVFGYMAWMDGLPSVPVMVAMLTACVFATSLYAYAASTSRFRWVSKSQAGTDYSMQSSVWNLGVWFAGSTAGLLAGSVGWTFFFPIAGALAMAGGLYYVLMFDRIEAMVVAREAAEMREAQAR